MGTIQVICEELISIQNAISSNPKIEVATPVSSSEVRFWKRAIHKNGHIKIYTHIFRREKLFFKTQSMNLACALQANFF